MVLSIFGCVGTFYPHISMLPWLFIFVFEILVSCEFFIHLCTIAYLVVHALILEIARSVRCIIVGIQSWLVRVVYRTILLHPFGIWLECIWIRLYAIGISGYWDLCVIEHITIILVCCIVKRYFIVALHKGSILKIIIILVIVFWIILLLPFLYFLSEDNIVITSICDFFCFHPSGS